ncbi:MAG: hypothetical protein JNM80_02425 [Phycisphaerae bacterium]|nr:hypothetical protein [Phycisphaerae bacterium]
MRVSIKASTGRELDLTHALVSAVAHELWKHAGGNEVVNWLEAERIVAGLIAQRPPESQALDRPADARAKRGRAALERAADDRRTRAWDDPQPLRRRERDEDLVTGPIPYR